MTAKTLQRTVWLSVLLLLALAAAASADGGGASLTISPATPTTADRVSIRAELTNPGLGPGFIVFGIARDSNIITITGSLVPACPTPPGPFFNDFDLGTLPSGFYRVVFHSPIASDLTSAFEVSSPTQGLSLNAGRFQVALLHGAVVTPGSTQVTGGQPAASVQLSDHSGYFWFYDSGNVELTLKILDGSTLNGHYWLFAASTTDQPFVIQVTDTQGTCSSPPCVKLFANPAGKNQNFIDLALFPK
jgi:hypothetical protein